MPTPPAAVIGLVLAVLAAGAGTLVANWPVRAGDPRSVVVRSAAGEVLARVPISGDRFAVSYRNSLYGSLAEERYRTTPEGRFVLDELAADQIAVLEEYYAVPGAPRRAAQDDRREFVAEPHPARSPGFLDLSIAATDLGERTLLVPGNPPVPLWRLVDGDQRTVVLDLQGVR